MLLSMVLLVCLRLKVVLRAIFLEILIECCELVLEVSSKSIKLMGGVGTTCEFAPRDLFYFLECQTLPQTQKTDQNYGPFKTQHAKNLDHVVDAHMSQKKNMTLPPWQVGLIVFGGIDKETNTVVPSAFEAGFSRDSCRRACLGTNLSKGHIYALDSAIYRLVPVFG
jgi:hypothetical protein